MTDQIVMPKQYTEIARYTIEQNCEIIMRTLNNPQTLTPYR